MIFRIFAVLLLITFSCPASAQEEIGDVRNYIWGVGPDDLAHYEQGTYFDRYENALLYLDYQWGLRSLITYSFTDEAELWRVEIENQKPYYRPDDLVNDFLMVQDAIEQRYGEPEKEEYLWYDDENKGYPSYLGWSIYERNLEITIHWINDRTDILLTLGMGDKDPDFRVVYKSLELEQKVMRHVEDDYLRIR